MKKLIEVTITLTSEEAFALGFYEPETGEYSRIDGNSTADESLIKRVGAELLSWVDITRDELKEDQQELCNSRTPK